MSDLPRRLSDLLAALDQYDLVDPAGVAPATLIDDVTHDSRAVRDGVLFCAVPGTLRNGADFVPEALTAGASALLVEQPLELGEGWAAVPQVVVGSVRSAMAALASELWGDPSSSVSLVGVTGTNGKTTVVSIVDQLVTHAGQRSMAVGTLTGERTTPESTDLARLLARAGDDGVEVVALEVSSHALALERVAALRFEVAAFTNLGNDHLDFHGTRERYFEAKSRLFQPGRSRVAVLNVDDVHGRLLRDTLVGEHDPVVVEVSAERAEPVLEATASRFTWRGHRVELPLAGRFNVTNALIAAECVAALGVPEEVIVAGLAGVVPPPGRFERVDAGQPFTVVVDYAHTPDALERVLEAGRELCDGQLVVVLGAGGDRDEQKRPAMGAAACAGADVVIVTSDNPRSEDPSTIMAAVAEGCVGVTPIMETDRRAAISVALADRSPGDVVVIAGKGHETTQTIGTSVLPFDDREVAREELAALGWQA